MYDLVVPSLAASLRLLAHCGNRSSFSRCSFELAQLVSLPCSQGWSTRYSNRLHDFSVTIPRCYKYLFVNSFFPCIAPLGSLAYRMLSSDL